MACPDQPVKFGCCCCAGGTTAWPNDVEPPPEPPPLLLVGDAHGSLGVGVVVLDGAPDALGDGAGVSLPALRWSAPADGLRLSTGTGIELEDGDAADGEPDAVGDALDRSPHSALSTGLADGDPLGDGEADAVLSDGIAEGLSEGRSGGLGPPPCANAVAAIDAKTAMVAAPRAADLRVIDPPPSFSASPDPRGGNRHSG
jgi:hypothetical protein